MYAPMTVGGCGNQSDYIFQVFFDHHGQVASGLMTDHRQSFGGGDTLLEKLDSRQMF